MFLLFGTIAIENKIENKKRINLVKKGSKIRTADLRSGFTEFSTPSWLTSILVTVSKV